VTVRAPLACDGETTHDPATRSVLVRVSGVGASFWRRGHTALMQAETPGSVFEFSRAASTVWAYGVRGEPVQDGWLRFKVDDATYRELRVLTWLRLSRSTGMLRRFWVSSSAAASRDASAGLI
jgi:hypothetical protein